jgi:hypothetical protein
MQQSKGYQPFYISYPSYEEVGPVCRTSEEADRWLSRQMVNSRRPDDWGYVNEVTLAGAIAA